MNVVFGGRIPQIVDNKIDVLRTIRDILEKLRSSCPTYTCLNIFNCPANLTHTFLSHINLSITEMTCWS